MKTYQSTKHAEKQHNYRLGNQNMHESDHKNKEKLKTFRKQSINAILVVSICFSLSYKRLTFIRNLASSFKPHVNIAS